MELIIILLQSLVIVALLLLRAKDRLTLWGVRVTRNDVRELNAWRVQWAEHRQWLAEFREIGMVLDNIRNCTGAEASHMTGTKEARFISELREELRSPRPESLDARTAGKIKDVIADVKASGLL